MGSGPTTSCPGEAAAISGDSGSLGLSGDVDGDGAADRVTVVVDPTGARGCQAYIVVEASGGRLVAPIEDFDPGALVGTPVLNPLVELTGRPGDEVVVTVAAGASTQFAAAFTFVGGALKRLTIDRPAYRDLFGWGGSVGHLDGSGCLRDHIVLTRATASVHGGNRRPSYEVTRRLFSVHGSRVVASGAIRLSSVTPRALSRVPELSGPPFSRCPP